MAYELHEKIGEGEFAEVYRATDTDLQRDVAVKILHPSEVGYTSLVEQARALVRAKHPNVVDVHGIFEIKLQDGETRQGIVMELVTGKTLEAVLKLGSIDAQICESIGVALLSAVRHLHGVPIAHGDLHEKNVMVDAGRVKVIDIYYTGTMAMASTQSRDSKTSFDRLMLRRLLFSILSSASIDRLAPMTFLDRTTRDPNIAVLEREFVEAVRKAPTSTPASQPATAGSTTERIKRVLRGNMRAMRIHDALESALRSPLESFHSDQFLRTGPQPDESSVPKRASDYEAGMREALGGFSVLGAWGDSEVSICWTRWLQRLSVDSENAPGTNFKAWVAMRRYPALLMKYAIGIAACYSQAFHNLNTLLRFRISIGDYEAMAFKILAPYAAIPYDAAKLLPGLHEKKTPVSDHLLRVMREPLRPLVADDQEYETHFNQFEVLEAMFSTGQGRENANDRVSVAGRFIWLSQMTSFENFAGGLRLPRQLSDNHPIVASGLFVSARAYVNAMKAVGGDAERMSL